MKLIPHGLLLRSLIASILVVLVAGMGSLAYTVHATSEQTRQRAVVRFDQLLHTVERTLQAACFVKDEGLASEIALGLLGNSEVFEVRIIESGRELAASRRQGPAAGSDGSPLALQRAIHSPFEPARIIGEIHLVADPQVIAAEISAQVRLAAVQVGWQLFFVAASVAGAMLLFVARPIASMSNRLHGMDPVSGERLAIPPGHANTEIGRLANDVNQLADRLVVALQEERSLHRQREVDERKYHAIFDNAETGIFIIDRSGTVISANPAFHRELNLPPSDAPAGGLRLLDLPWETLTPLTPLIEGPFVDDTAHAGDVCLHDAGGQRRWLNMVLSPIGDGLLQGVVHDVSTLKEAEALARRQAITDPLTGLANRHGIEQRLRDGVASLAQGQSSGLALVMVDLDGFSKVNEGIGLPAGDEVLRVVTSRLLSCVKESDTVARLAADIFVVMLQNVSRSATALKVVGRIVNLLRQPYLVEGSPIVLHASIGIALAPNDGEDVPTLLRHAELAVDKAKAAGGDTHVFFDPTLSRIAEHRRQLEKDLRQALHKEEFVLFYQPVVDLHARRLVGAEALIRWRHPERGLVSPDAFIPLAEQTGIIDEIGLWVFDSVCRQISAWRAAGHDYRISFNVSGRQIPDGLSPEILAETLRRYAVPPQSIALEITEGVLLADVDQARAWLNAAHGLGMRVYLDDFGTGYSSLSYLKRFPVDTLKVDKSFVLDMHDDGNERTLVEAIIAMGRSLGLDVVAEGVESAAHADLLRHMGCHYAQGYHFARPLPVAEFEAAAGHIAAQLAPAAAR